MNFMQGGVRQDRLNPSKPFEQHLWVWIFLFHQHLFGTGFAVTVFSLWGSCCRYTPGYQGKGAMVIDMQAGSKHGNVAPELWFILKLGSECVRGFNKNQWNFNISKCSWLQALGFFETNVWRQMVPAVAIQHNRSQPYHQNIQNWATGNPSSSPSSSPRVPKD